MEISVSHAVSPRRIGWISTLFQVLESGEEWVAVSGLWRANDLLGELFSGFQTGQKTQVLEISVSHAVSPWVVGWIHVKVHEREVGVTIPPWIIRWVASKVDEICVGVAVPPWLVGWVSCSNGSLSHFSIV